MKGMNKPSKEPKKSKQKPGKKINVPKTPKRGQIYPQQA